ncbi:histidinol-phosphate transaminase [Candidatus Omnitrophota bacterium]
MLARKHLRMIKNYQPGKPIQEVKRQLGLRQVIKLASNESPFGVSSKLRRAIENSIADINRYPDASSFYLKRKLASLHKVRPENIILGNGSDELIVLALRAFCEPGDEVIVGYPTFLIYEIQAKACGLSLVKSRLKDFRYDLGDIKKKITHKTKIIFIANPDNPNGTYLSAKEITAFVRSIPKNVIVFLDEAYFEFAPKDFPKSISFVRSGRNVIFTRTFSKAYSLAGLRIGYAIARTEIIQAFDKVREPFNVNLLAQAAALAALGDSGSMRTFVRFVDKEKKYLYRQLDALGLSYVRSVTNFVLIDLKKKRSRRVFKALLKKGVIVRDMSAWGLKNFIRVTIGKQSENRTFIKSLKAVL